MDNEQKKWNKENPFKVNIEDDGFLNPDELEKILPVEPQKKKFEVHIEENIREFDSGEQQPEYKGEIYFSNRRPVRPAPQQPVNVNNNRTVNNNKKSSKKKQRLKIRTCNFSDSCYCFYIRFFCACNLLY